MPDLPAPGAVDAAIARVLAAEAAAMASIEAAAREAAAIVEEGRRDARAIVERTERRVRVARARHEAAVADRVAAIDARAVEPSTPHALSDAERALVAQAADEVATELAGGA